MRNLLLSALLLTACASVPPPKPAPVPRVAYETWTTVPAPEETFAPLYPIDQELRSPVVQAPDPRLSGKHR